MNDANQINKPIFDLSVLNLPSLPDAFADDKPSAQQSGEKFIVFVLDNELFAVSSKRVAEVAQPIAVTPLPNLPEKLLGIANLRGEIISVANLRKILGKNNSNAATKTKFIILRPHNSFSPIAFAVDKLSEFITLSNKEIEPVDQSESPFIFGKNTYKSKPLQFINLEKLFAAVESV